MVTALYAALCGFLLVFLSIRVIKARRAGQVPIGGGRPDLDRTRAVQGNFLDYTPLTLLLMALAEYQGVPAILIHAAGATLIVSRTVHAYGVSQESENYRFRVGGMIATFSNLIFCSLLNLYGFLSGQVL